MASPNASYDDLLSTTIQELESELFDQISVTNALTAALKESGSYRAVDGGPTIVQPIMYEENGSYKRYSGAETLDTTFNETMSAFQFPWCQVALNIQAHGRELMQNSGASQRRDLIKSRVLNAKASFENNFNEDLLSDGSATNQINGLQALISDNGTGTVGGIARASYAFAKNQFYRCNTDGGAVATASNIGGYMDALDLLIQTYKGRTKFIIADNAFFKLFEGAVNPLQRIVGNEKGTLGKLGFRTYMYKDAEVIFESTVAGMPASTMYFIDPSVIDLVYHSQRNLVRLPKRDSFNQDTQIEYLAWMGNLVVKNFRRLGVLNND